MPDTFTDEEIGLTPLSDEDIGLKQLAADELKRKTFEAKIEAEQGKALSALTGAGIEASKAIVRAFSYIDPTGFSQGLMNQYGVEPVHVIPPEKVLPDVQTVSEFTREGLRNIGVDPNVVLPEQYRKPVEEFAAENIAALPEMAPLMTAGVAAPKPVARVFQAQMLRGVPEAAYQAATAETPEERLKAGLSAGMGLALPALIEHGIREPSKPIPDIPGSRLEQPRGAMPPAEEVAHIERATPEQAAAQAEQMAARFEEKPATEPSILAPEKPEVAPVEKPVEEPTKMVESKPVEPLSDEQVGLTAEKPAKSHKRDYDAGFESGQQHGSELKGVSSDVLYAQNLFKATRAINSPSTEPRIKRYWEGYLDGVKSKEPSPKPAEAPAEAVAKAETKVQDVAQTEGVRPAKEIKSELLDRLQKAIEEAPTKEEVAQYEKPQRRRYKETITIEIPDDGTFVVPNTKENISEVLARANRISTSANVANAPRIYRASQDIARQAEAASQAYGSVENAYRSVKRQKDSLQSQETPRTEEERNQWNKQIDDAEYLMRELYGNTKAGQLEQQAETASDRAATYRMGAKGFEKEIKRIESLKKQTVAHKGRLDDLRTRYAQNQQFIADYERDAAKWEQEAAKEKAKLESPEMIGMGGAEPIPQGPGARTAPTIETPESYEGTGLKNAIGEVERVSYGLPEATPTQRRTMGEAWIKSARVLQENPLAGERLVSELRNNPKRALTDEDSAVLLRHKVSLENEMNRAAELTNIAEDPAIKAENQARYQMLSDQFLELLDMAKARGSEWGREGRWRQAIANQDYSLATMEARTRASLGGRRLTDAEKSKLQKDYDELKASQKAYEDRIAKHEAEVEDLQLKLAQEKAARAEAGEGPAIHPTILKIANDIVSKLDTAADRARARIRERATRFSAGIDPTVILDLTEIGASHLAHKVLDFAKWSDRMIGEFGDWVKPHLEEVFAKSQKAIDDLAERHGKTKAAAVRRALKEPTAKEVGDAVAEKVRDRIQKKELSAISGYLQKLARALWKEGVRDRDEIVKQMHGFISQKVPDITPREVSRMWSGYGDYRQLSKDEISVGLRKLKGELLETHKLEDMAEGRPPLKSGSERGEISEARRQLIKKVNDAKYKFQIPIEDPNTQLKSALDTYKTTLQNRIADLEDRMARKDYAPRVRRELVLDETAMDLKAKNLRVRQRFEQELEKNRLANRKPWQKLLDNFVRWERAFKLSSPVVFGKLGAAAMTRLATTTAEEAVGAGLGKLPVISEVAKRAPREGGISIEGMSKGLATMVTKGIQDAKQTAKSGMTDLDILLGKEGGLDREWVNVFGQLHGMMKAPIKRFEYELSLQKRIEAAMRNGEDVRNREVMLRLMTEAMNDGYRSIFMQRGFTADLFNTALHMAETSKKYQPQGEIFARTMRFLLPIVRVPVNIVSETATGITGIPVASARVMFHAINGSLKTMDPKVADAILRQFKKGSIGAGLIAIGFMNPDNIGGYDWREKRGPNAPKAGGFQLFGWNVPRWMTHAPWFELMQFGATLRHAINNKKKGLSEGALAASVGLIEQTPFYGEMMRVTQAGESGSRFGAFTGELARSTIVPQALQKIAEWTDFTDKKRKPKNWYQHVMYGVPGLRQYVPEQTTNSNKF